MRLHTILEVEGDDPTTNRVWQALKAYPLFDPNHPDDLLFDGQRRAELNQRIIEHYYLREMGHETVSVFVFQLRKKLREVMPQYNGLYRSELLKFDPISSIGVTTKRNDTSTNTSNRSSNAEADNTGNATSRNVTQDFPQTELADGADYATGGGISTSGSRGNTKSTSQDIGSDEATANGESTSTGYQGSPSRLLTEFRSTILNIDMMVVGDLEELFLGIFDLGVDVTGGYLDSGLYQPVPLLGRNHLYS
jgi:hypothetical protein